MKTFRTMMMLVLLVLAVPAFAQRKITIKMASPVPENTPWGKFFNQLAADWRRISNGEVDMVIYHNGVAGSEKEVVRNLRVNQVQAAVLSTFGLYEISPEIMTLSCPFLIRDNDELDLVIAGLRDELEDKINSKGYFTLAWARVGWVKFFSKQPIFVPADLKKQKMGTIADQSEMNEIFKTMGFQMVPVALNDILIALSSNMVDAVFQSPMSVGSMQVFGLAKNMASINIAPLLGTIVINQRTWRAIPEKYKPQMLEAVKRIETELDSAMLELENDIFKMMESYGLKVNQLTPQQEQLWYDEIGKAMPSLIGTFFDRKVYGRIDAILRAHRNKQR